MSHDSTRPRLQLSLGGAALLGEERPSLGGRRVFAANCRESGSELLVTLHPLPPEGPTPLAVLGRASRLQALAHPRLNTPIAAGDLDGRAWVVEPAPTSPSVLLRLSDGGAFGVKEGVRVLREVTRAVASLHRTGLAHGALELETVQLAGGEVKVGGLANRTTAEASEDIAALGPLAWALFTGDLPDATHERLAQRRRGIPAGLDALVASLLSPDPSLRPPRAESVLAALDSFPASDPAPFSTFLDGAGRGARTPRGREAVLLAVLFGLSVLISGLVFGR
ncbi:MAG: hypothetical protein ABJC19_07430 [Gemmatimonadota bacterium]